MLSNRNSYVNCKFGNYFKRDLLKMGKFICTDLFQLIGTNPVLPPLLLGESEEEADGAGK